ncbi:hypothetical protein VTJ49DRAFT_1832 [Mycothermus thermophilus]|uniref:Something about silencing protein 4 domain-containing protein n=1 Tax=Humicola insolens TaxID=85995 RepID=A0ABR3VBN8_HUMIN
MALTASIARPRRSDGLRIATSPIVGGHRHAHHPRLLPNAKADPYHATPPPRPGSTANTAVTAATATTNGNNNNIVRNTANSAKRRQVDVSGRDIDHIAAKKTKFATDKTTTPVPPPTIPLNNNTTTAAKKRQLDASDRDDPIVPKKPRFTTAIAVEIPARTPAFHAQFQAATVTSPLTDPKPTTTATVTPALRQSQKAPSPRPALAAPSIATNGPTATTSATSHRPSSAHGASAAMAAARTTKQSQPTRRTRKQQQQQQEEQQEQQAQPSSGAAHTRHQKKVANGLRNELDKLHQNSANLGDYANADGAVATTRTSTRANATDTTTAAASSEQTGGRKLRSQEGTRYKSELSAYFPEYDEVIGNDPKETRQFHSLFELLLPAGHLLRPESRQLANQCCAIADLVNLDTAIIVVPDVPSQSMPEGSNAPSGSTPVEAWPVRSYADSLYTDLFDAQRIDFSFLTNNSSAGAGASSKQTRSTNPKDDDSDPDPLPDSVYTAAHKKAERLERSIRNTEKGRAQHERDQVARLLDALQGPDWLRTLGVGGATESKRRAFEPARDYFIKGCEAILDKFRRWQAEEKRKRRAELEGRKAAQASASGENNGAEETEDGLAERGSGAARKKPSTTASSRRRGIGAGRGRKTIGDNNDDDCSDNDDDRAGPKGEPPDSGGDSDEDASVAKQLREEARAAEIARKRHLAALKGWETKRAMRAAAEREKEMAAKGGGRGAKAAREGSVTAGRKGQTAKGKEAAGAGKGKKVANVIKTRKQAEEEEIDDSDGENDADHESDADSDRENQKPTKKGKATEDKEEKEIKSFFSRPYQREAALSKTRRRGRTVLAWGQPVPDPPEAEFVLPDEWKRAGAEAKGKDVNKEGGESEDVVSSRPRGGGRALRERRGGR